MSIYLVTESDYEYINILFYTEYENIAKEFVNEKKDSRFGYEKLKTKEEYETEQEEDRERMRVNQERINVEEEIRIQKEIDELQKKLKKI